MGHRQAEKQGQTMNVDSAGRFEKVLPNKGGQALEEMSKVAVVSLGDFRKFIWP